MRNQNLVKVGQTRLNLINGHKTTGLGETHIRILIIWIEEYGDILVLGKLKNNWTDRRVHNTCPFHAILRFEI